MRQLVIDRTKWFRGKGPEASRLLTDDGRMCCLGFECKAHGISDREIFRVSNPNVIPTLYDNKSMQESLRWLIGERTSDLNGFFSCTEDCRQLVKINDDELIAESDREQQIAEVFKRNNIEVQFVN